MVQKSNFDNRLRRLKHRRVSYQKVEESIRIATGDTHFPYRESQAANRP